MQSSGQSMNLFTKIDMKAKSLEAERKFPESNC